MSIIKVHQKDNVAVAIHDLQSGDEIRLPWGGILEVGETIPARHKVALEDIPAYHPIYRYGQPIGIASLAISKGHLVHTHNLGAPEGFTPSEVFTRVQSSVSVPEGGTSESFLGYPRAKGPPGIRNHVLVFPTVACANGVVRAVGRAVPESVTLEHGYGCGRRGEDHCRTLKVLTGCGTHPNVGAVILVGLGCERVRGEDLANELASWGKPLEYLEIQKQGGSRRTADKGIKLARSLWAKVCKQSRRPQPLDELILGLQCGGSDGLSGVTANPTVGWASDWVVARGGTVILAETTEMIGTSEMLQARAAEPAVAEAIRSMIYKNERLTKKLLGDQAHLAIAHGNVEGGLSSIMEKSLGCITKGGSTVIKEAVPYAQRPTRKGLVLMDTPGYDVESLGGLVAAGVQVILFTTGRGSPIGAPLVPVIKIASNSDLWHRMMEDMDLNAGEVADGLLTIEESGRKLVQCLLEVLEGRSTRSEENNQEVLGLAMTGEAL